MPGPGVTVTTATRSGPSAPLRAQSGQYFVAGQAERGSVTTPTKIRSMADYGKFFGDRVSYGTLYDDLRTFFAEGGTQAQVIRVVGTATTLGTITLQDRSGAPANTLRVDAENPGAWSANLTVEVQDGINTDTFRIIVRLDGVIVDDHNNLHDPTEAVQAFSTSPYVRVTDMGSVSAAPANNPAVIGPTALSAGSDDRATVVAQNYVDALDLFPLGMGDGAVAIPGIGPSGHAGLIAHAEANRRIAILAANQGTDVATLMGMAASLDSEYAGLFAPWVVIPDGYMQRTISPEGYVAACRNRAHEAAGPWRAPAGQIAEASFIRGLDQTFTKDEGETLNDGRVSAIRVIANTIRLYGWRSLSSDEQDYRLLTGRDTLNRLVVESETRLEKYVFQTIDGKGQLLSAVNAELVGIVEPIRAVGGIYERHAENGDLLDPGYSVDTSSAVNTVDTIASNEIHAILAVRISPTGEFVYLTIVKVGITASV